MVSSSLKKGLCLALLITGYQAAAICYSTWELCLGGATFTFLLGTIYYRGCYNGNCARFEEHEFLRDAYDEAKSIKNTSLKECFEVFDGSKSFQENRAKIKNILPKNWKNCILLSQKKGHCDLDLMWVDTKLQILKESKRNLEAKQALWADNKTKELVNAQLSLTLRETNLAIAVLEAISDALTQIRTEIAQKMDSGLTLNT